MSAEYEIDVMPRTAVLGTPVTAELRCRAHGKSPGVLTFEHKSLVLELSGERLPEPCLAFPNRFAVEDGPLLVRMSSPGGVEDLEDGELRVRKFDLLALFPDAMLHPGRVQITYRLEDADPPVRPKPSVIELQSGPEAVPMLIDCLDSPSEAIRFFAQEILGQMTGQQKASRAEWTDWWTGHGSRLPWNYDSDGALFNAAPSEPVPHRRSKHLGGVEYPGSSADDYE